MPRVGIVRIMRQRRVVGLDRLLQMARARQGIAAVVLAVGVVERMEILRRLRKIAGLQLGIRLAARILKEP